MLRSILSQNKVSIKKILAQLSTISNLDIKQLIVSMVLGKFVHLLKSLDIRFLNPFMSKSATLPKSVDSSLE